MAWGAAGSLDGAPLLALQGLLPLAGNSIPHSPGTDACRLVMAAALASDRQLGDFPLAGLDLSCWSPRRLGNRSRSSSILHCITESQASSMPRSLDSSVGDAFVPLCGVIAVAAFLLCSGGPSSGFALSAPPVLGASIIFSKAFRASLPHLHISGQIESVVGIEKGFNSLAIWWVWKVRMALSLTRWLDSGVNISPRRHIKSARSSSGMYR